MDKKRSVGPRKKWSVIMETMRVWRCADVCVRTLLRWSVVPCPMYQQALSQCVLSVLVSGMRPHRSLLHVTPNIRND